MALHWIGSATDRAQVNTYTVAGTWTGNPTITITLGSGELVITIGTGTTTDNVAEAISNAINANSATENLESDETRTVGGQEIPEFTEITASVAGSVVTVTGNTAGVPFASDTTGTDEFPKGLAMAETAAGSITAATTTMATGRNWFDNGDNWRDDSDDSIGTAPVNSDTLIFQQSDVPCLYGLTADTRLTGLKMQSDASFTAAIGLPKRNGNGYEEWRPRFLAHDFASAASGAATIRIGDGDGAGSSRINIEIGSSTPRILVLKTNTPESGSDVSFDLIGGATGTTLNVNRGVVGFCNTAIDATSDIQGVCDLNMAYVSGQASDAIVYVGRTADVENVVKSGGILTINTALHAGPNPMDNFTQKPGDSGTTTINGENGITNFKAEGGTVIVNTTGDVGATLYEVGGTATVDYSRDNRPKTIGSTVERYTETSAFLDPNGTISGLVLDYNNIRPDRTGDQLGINVRLTRGSVA